MRSASRAAASVSRTPSGEQHTTRLRTTMLAGATASGCARTSATRKRLLGLNRSFLCEFHERPVRRRRPTRQSRPRLRRSQAIQLDRSDASTNLEHSSTIEFFGWNTRHHLALDRTKPLLSISLQVLARHHRLEHLFARSGATATRHNGMILRSKNHFPTLDTRRRVTRRSCGIPVIAGRRRGAGGRFGLAAAASHGGRHRGAFVGDR